MDFLKRLFGFGHSAELGGSVEISVRKVCPQAGDMIVIWLPHHNDQPVLPFMNGLSAMWPDVKLVFVNKGTRVGVLRREIGVADRPVLQ